jgi:hypothetical protein
VNVSNAGPIVQSRGKDGLGYTPRYGVKTRCPCGGKIEIYALDLGCCQTCGADYYMTEVYRKPHSYRLKEIPGRHVSGLGV